MPQTTEFDALPAGTRLGEFEVQRVLGVGGFGVVYLAFDHALERQVAIKEYMPSSLAGRVADGRIQVRSAAAVDTYKLGLRSFINEARLLARFDHPSLVKVYRFWEAHGTAYMVMPYYKGRTLQQVRRDMSAPPDEAWLRRLISPLLGALACLHSEQVYHRDVAPDNILLLDDDGADSPGQPVLLDLGAARRVIGDHTHALTAIVKPSFAPIEQYAETVQLRQGPWTDLYALAAVVHFCVTGRPPIPATARTVHDELPSLRSLAHSLARDFDRHFSETFLCAMDHALAVRPLERPESVAAWQAELSGVVVGESAHLGQVAEADMAHTVLVRPESGVMPEGHERVHAQAYLTTVPAANPLSAKPAWVERAAPPAPSAPASAPVAAPTATPISAPDPATHEEWATHMSPVIPPTMPMPPAQAGGVRPVARLRRQPTSGVSRWVWLALASLVALALWWSQHKATRQAADPAVAAAPLSGPGGLPGAVAAADADRAGAASAAQSAAASGSSKRKGQHLGGAQIQAGESGKPQAGSSAYLNPRQACGNRMFITMAICMKRHCAKSAYAGHPECKRMREQEAAQQGSN